MHVESVIITGDDDKLICVELKYNIYKRKEIRFGKCLY
jgi:hypothetical protein